MYLFLLLAILAYIVAFISFSQFCTIVYTYLFVSSSLDLTGMALINSFSFFSFFYNYFQELMTTKNYLSTCLQNSLKPSSSSHVCILYFYTNFLNFPCATQLLRLISYQTMFMYLMVLVMFHRNYNSMNSFLSIKSIQIVIIY